MEFCSKNHISTLCVYMYTMLIYLSIHLYTYIYVYIYIYNMCIYIYIYVWYGLLGPSSLLTLYLDLLGVYRHDLLPAHAEGLNAGAAALRLQAELEGATGAKQRAPRMQNNGLLGCFKSFFCRYLTHFWDPGIVIFFSGTAMVV